MSKRRLTDLVDHFIPHSIWRTCPDAANVARARILVAVLGFSLIVLVIALLLVVILHFFTQNDFLQAITILVAITMLLLIQHLIFQASANLYVTAIAFSVTAYLSLAISTLCTGGWTSPVIPLLLCTPIVVFLISGLTEAEYTVVLTFATGVVFMMLEIMQVEMPNIMHEENRTYAKGVVWFVACVILMLLFATQKWLKGLEEDPHSIYRHSMHRDSTHQESTHLESTHPDLNRQAFIHQDSIYRDSI